MTKKRQKRKTNKTNKKKTATNAKQINNKQTKTAKQVDNARKVATEPSFTEQAKKTIKEHPWGTLPIFWRWVIVILCFLALGGICWYTWHEHAPESLPNQSLSSSQQTSLIKTETKAVKNNAKPRDVVDTLLKRQKKLSKHNQKLSSDLMYTSMQNATLYYNNAADIMGGEVDYSRPANSKNSLDSSKDNAWVQGFLAEIERQHLVAYNYSASQILILPDFAYLQKQLNNSGSKELNIFLDSAVQAQKMKVFSKNEVNMVEAANAYQTIMLGSLNLAKTNANSKYLQDFASLARIYHDLALGFGKDNNLTKKDEKYQYSTASVSALKIIAKNKNQLLASDAKKVLNQLDGKSHTVAVTYLNQMANNSAKQFGTSVYWQNQTDISAMLNQGK